VRASEIGPELWVRNVSTLSRWSGVALLGASSVLFVSRSFLLARGPRDFLLFSIRWPRFRSLFRWLCLFAAWRVHFRLSRWRRNFARFIGLFLSRRAG